MRFALELALRRNCGVGVVAMDGKTMGGVWEGGEQLRVLHLFSQASAVALDQVAVKGHLDGPRAAQAWIEQVAGRIEGLKVLTGDALYADADLCQAIVDQGKDYLVKLKKNWPQLHRDVELLFSDPGPPEHSTVCQGHGRREGREVWVSEELATYTGFPGLASVIRVHQVVRNNLTSRERNSVQYGVSSLSDLAPDRALALLRGHWEIENRLF